MHTGQFIYLLVAFMLFSSFSLALNRFQVAATITTVEAQQVNDAISLAQMLSEEAWTKSFDEMTVPENQVGSAGADYPDDFTETKDLGTESGEVYPDFDDVDDYNDLDYSLIYGSDSLNVKGRVFYISTTVDTLCTSSCTFNKMLQFTITSPRNELELTFEYIYSYFGT
ncbi:MAG: hypothetical protein K8R90_05680 [Candidatus Cloacimonetes bacterium]|nr:hypothetical protein [Candidatus Cloacimonadota bacterium]